MTMTAGRYRPSEVCDAGIADKLGISAAYLKRMRASRPELFDANVNGSSRTSGSALSPGSATPPGAAGRVVSSSPDRGRRPGILDYGPRPSRAAAAHPRPADRARPTWRADRPAAVLQRRGVHYEAHGRGSSVRGSAPADPRRPLRRHPVAETGPPSRVECQTHRRVSNCLRHGWPRSGWHLVNVGL